MILTMNQLHLLEVVVTVVQLEWHDSCLWWSRVNLLIKILQPQP